MTDHQTCHCAAYHAAKAGYNPSALGFVTLDEIATQNPFQHAPNPQTRTLKSVDEAIRRFIEAAEKLTSTPKEKAMTTLTPITFSDIREGWRIRSQTSAGTYTETREGIARTLFPSIPEKDFPANWVDGHGFTVAEDHPDVELWRVDPPPVRRTGEAAPEEIREGDTVRFRDVLADALFWVTNDAGFTVKGHQPGTRTWFILQREPAVLRGADL